MHVADGHITQLVEARVAHHGVGTPRVDRCCDPAFAQPGQQRQYRVDDRHDTVQLKEHSIVIPRVDGERYFHVALL